MKQLVVVIAALLAAPSAPAQPTWVHIPITGRPPARFAHAQATDSSRQRIVVFSGMTSGWTKNDTWEFDGESWVNRTSAASPDPRWGSAFAYDPVRRCCLMFGGDANGASNQTWEYDGTKWHRKSPTRIPPHRRGAGLAFDPKSKRMVLFGGENRNGYLDDTWAWDGSNWTQLHPPTSPPARSRFGMATDTLCRCTEGSASRFSSRGTEPSCSRA